MKKKLARFAVSVVVVLIFSAVCYYISFQSLIKKYRESYSDTEKGQTLDDYLYMNEEQENDSNDAVSANTEQNVTVRPDTFFYLETYDSNGQKLTKEAQVLPPEFVGLNRTGLIDYLEEYMANIPLKEYQKGLTAYELLSFSDESITLRKTYNSAFSGDSFFVTLYNGSVVVYYSDLKSVYEYTDISATVLSEDEKDTLVTGIYVKDIEELYDILASYTS